MAADIQRHGEQINAIFNTGLEPVQVSKMLHRLENKMHRITTDYCNGIIDSEQYERIETATLDKLDKILAFRKLGIPVFVNGDARGYALKIRDTWINDQYRASGGTFRLTTDMGGYGIIAPDFTPVNQTYNK
jgi:hypothetical protein